MPQVITSDSYAFLQGFKEYEFDIIFADPPYALGSEVIIREDGKVDYAKASDFMNKWDMPTGEYWGKWFLEAFRTLKHGGWLIMYGMDRQLLLFKYYASMAGFQETQSLYWYYISNFPKATDLSKMIDKNAGAEREQGEFKYKNGATAGGERIQQLKGGVECYESLPSTDLAKKYQGYKYSISPLKQTCETIMVFKKPSKTGSVLHDTLAMENGDDTITCGALDIDRNRVAATDKAIFPVGDYGESNFRNNKRTEDPNPDGRYPSQTFIDTQVAERLDLQSGVFQSNSKTIVEAIESKISTFGASSQRQVSRYEDVGGCSKILHKCDYEQIDYDLFIYEPKVDGSERNNGVYNLDEKQYIHDGRNKPIENPYQRNNSVAFNNHPTLKPIDLNGKILKLFKTPNEQKICYPFAGSGSEVIGGLQANYQNWVACEINQDYVDIANARIKHYQENEHIQLNLFDL
jgi:site-specific DNA-methyltransferase (adenine-specific)